MEFVLYSIVAFCFLVICVLLLRMDRTSSPKKVKVKKKPVYPKRKIPVKNILFFTLIALSALLLIWKVSNNLVQKDSDTPTSNYTETTSAEEKEETVYWVAKGKVWHVTRNCSTLARSSNIYSGTVKQSGKPRVCDVCG